MGALIDNGKCKRVLKMWIPQATLFQTTTQKCLEEQRTGRYTCAYTNTPRFISEMVIMMFTALTSVGIINVIKIHPD